MEWLSQNWIWLALGIGAVLMMGRGAHGGHGGCCGGSGHGGDDKSSDLKSAPPGEAVGHNPGHQHH